MKRSRVGRSIVVVTITAFLGSDMSVVWAQQPYGTLGMPMGGAAPAFGDYNGFPDGRFLMGVPQSGMTAPQRTAPPRQGSLQTVNSCRRSGLQTAAARRGSPVEAGAVPAPAPAPAPTPGGAVVTQVAVQGGGPGAGVSGAAGPQADSGVAAGVGGTWLYLPEEEPSRLETAFNYDLTQITGGRVGGLRQFGQVDGPAEAAPGTRTAPPAADLGTGTVRPADLRQEAPAGPGSTPLHQYGYAMFAGDVSTFAPVDDIPVGPDYVLGPGDDLSINVWGPIDSAVVRTVDRNGRIVLPKVGDLRVWGLTFSQADRLIREQLSRYFRGFQTSVTMGRLRTVRVHVVGEVCQPGAYTLSSLATLTNALFSAGGPTKLGSLRDIRLLRNHHTVGALDLYDFLLRGDRTHDFRLESGDTIFVPTVGDVAAVAGEVKRPAIYEVRGAERVSDLLDMAGGLTPRGYLKRVQIVRSQPNAERVTLDVDLSEYYLKGDETNNPPVNAGDLVLIYRSDQRVYNTVRVDGAVKYPGTYELKPMMRLSQLLAADKVLPEAYTERIEVARRRDDFSVEILPISLKRAWGGDASQDVLLKPLDEITVRTELRPVRSVTLAGEVVRPGAYVISEGERLSSVLERAGGFKERAFLRGAAFTRAALRQTEQKQLDEFVRLQEQRLLAQASTVVVGADRDETLLSQQSLQTRRELLRALARRTAVGRLVVRLDVPEALRGSKDDIVLVDGDVLTVPEPPSSVLVVGAVRQSTSVLHKEGANVEYYVSQVGGFTKDADRKELHIVKADGSAISSFTNIRDVDAGDTIVVPPKAEEKIRALPTIRDVAQIAGSALLSFAALALLF